MDGDHTAPQPTGVLTFLFTDVEGSTRAWNDDPEGMAEGLAVHDRALREAFARHGGYVFSHAGDSFGVAFSRPRDALDAVIEAQRALRDTRVRSRMGLHVGTAEARDGGYYGPETNRGARIMALAHGGQVLMSDAFRALMDHTIEVRDLGRQELAGFDAPERLYQLLHPDLPDDFPPLPGVRRHNLPRFFSSFVGREREMRAVPDHVRSTGVVTLLGPGGIGKTRLAVEVARTIRDEFDDGVWFVDLTTVRHGELVMASVASALRLRLGEGSEPRAALERHVADRNVLIVLDNCEHVLEGAADVAMLATRAGEQVRVLATSRARLRIPGETVMPVYSLDTASETAEATRLFLERAERAAPGTGDDPNLRAVATELCRRLDGMPLAIELAASRVGELPPELLLDHLSDRFALLDDGATPREDQRSRSLRATVEWSLDLLPERVRETFLRLSVFAAAFPLTAAEVVAAPEVRGPEDMLGELSVLTGASLLQVVRVDGGVRYRLLETFRAYGLDELRRRGELRTWRDRHADHVLDQVEELARSPYDSEGTLRRRRATRELAADVYVAFDHLIELRDLDRLQRMLLAMSELWWEHRPRDGVPFYERAVAACGDETSPAADQVRSVAAALLFFMSSPRRAQEIAEPVVRRHEERGVPAPTAAYVALSIARLLDHDVEGARWAARRLEEVGGGSPDATERVLAFGFGGWVLASIGDADEGLRLLGQALSEDDGRTAWSIAVSNMYADALSMAGRFDEAIAFCDRQVAGRFDLTSYGRIQMLRVLTHAHLLAGRVDAAAKALFELLGEVIETGDVVMAPLALEATAVLLARQRQAEPALVLYHASEALREDRYVGAPLELLAREWLRGRLRHLLGEESVVEGRPGAVLGREAALELAQSSLQESWVS